MLGLKRGTVKLVEYDPKWKDFYEAEKRLIKKALGNIVLDIEHIGSTSIPHIMAKPVIDIEVGIKNLSDLHLLEKIAEKLESIGYQWRRQSSNPDNHVFVKGPEDKRTQYLHLVEFQGEVWRNDLFFRDKLRRDQQLAKEYEKLKTQLAEQFLNERSAYTKSKGSFFEKVLKKKI